MTFIPTLPSSFRSLNDPILKYFLEEICENRKIRSFAERAKAANKSSHAVQTFQDRHYLELAILNILGRKESKLLLNFPDEQLITDSLFEAAEFISVLKDVFRQTPSIRKNYLKGHFNSGFDGVMGMIPLAHEINVAHALYKNGFEVEFTEYGGTAAHDFSVRKGDLAAQVDCKACGGDNGKIFKMAVTDTIYERIKKSVKSNKDTFDGKILCLSISDRSKIAKDVPLAAKRTIDSLIKGSQHEEVDGLRAELFDFDIGLANLIKSVESGKAEQKISELVADYLRMSCGKSDIFPEWHFVPPPHFLDVTRFACVFCSPTQVEWRKNAIKVVRQSLSGQLKDCPCPVIFLRYSDLSDEDVSRAWFANTDVEAGKLNPLDALFHDIVTDPIGKRLCALFFQHRPRFHESSILGPTGQAQTAGRYPIRSLYNRSHPNSEALKASMRW